jgi:hypothetical protein
MLSVVMLNVANKPFRLSRYAECRYAECRGADEWIVLPTVSLLSSFPLTENKVTVDEMASRLNGK